MAAVLAFSAVGLKETMEPLIRYMKARRNPVVDRAFVAEAIGLAGNLEGLPPLSRLAAGHNFGVAAAAIDLAIRLRCRFPRFPSEEHFLLVPRICIAPMSPIQFQSH